MSGIVTLLSDLKLNLEDIAKKTKLPLERVKAILAGQPYSAAELRALSSGLQIPLQAFAQGHSPASEDTKLGILFRKTTDVKENYDHTLSSVASYVEAALKILPRRESNPEWLDELAPAKQTPQEASRSAGLFRARFTPKETQGEILNLGTILANEAGVIIGRLKRSRYEGASVLTDGYAFVFISPRFPARMLFTLAHELGHLIAHHRSGERAAFDKPTQIGSGKKQNLEELFVDAFASNVLMPDRGVGIALDTIRELFKIKTTPHVGDIEILYLSRIFGVSFDVAARRCEALELLPRGGANSLIAEIKKLYRNPEVRARGLELPPRRDIHIPKISSILLRSIAMGIERGDISSGWAAERFGISVGEIFSENAGIGRELHS